jgi:VWFA-related protein
MTILCLLCGLVAALPAAQETPATQPPAAEMVSEDTAVTFKSRVNVVLVPVVVRDHSNGAVGDLRREDFQLFDRGKPQAITSFTVERQGQRESVRGAEQAAAAGAAPEQPDRFVIYLFDDLHLEFGDLARTREAAQRHFERAFDPGTRAALFSTSGQVMVDFTEDRAALEAGLRRLAPRNSDGIRGLKCPDLDYYIADLIENHNDPQALQVAIRGTTTCPGMDAVPGQMVEQAARMAARDAVATGEHNTRMALSTLQNAVRRISVMPGRRSIVLASPGFLTSGQESEITTILERAIHASVVINTLDARGLYAEAPGGDVSQRTVTFDPVVTNEREQYRTGAARVAADILGSLADGTGGTFFHNDNGLFEGLQRTGARPEAIYVLGFAPQNLKLDGRFHNLKVTLKDGRKLEVRARRGYYAPTQLADAAAQAKEEIREAVYSREELSDLPVGLNTQFFKPTDDTARLSVLIHLDLKAFQFRKAEGRNQDKLTIVSALFDGNGNYVAGVEKKIELRLRDETLQARLASGITVRNTLNVKPGRYAIRLVVRESEGQLMAAQNGAVEIP